VRDPLRAYWAIDCAAWRVDFCRGWAEPRSELPFRFVLGEVNTIPAYRDSMYLKMEAAPAPAWSP
jgi:D-alanine-D-alanine ligase-like ATP-grasp enzyme